MNKVKVTQKQADWLERYELTQEQIDHYIDMQPLNKRPDSPIADWEASKVAKALYIGYEVEETFKKGDWVKVNWRDEEPSIHKVVKDSDGCRVKIDGNQSNISPGLRIVEHATPEEIAIEKERRWWASHGRKPWEIRDNDVLSINDLILDVTHVGEEYIAFNNHDIDWMDWEEFNSLKHNIRVVCFAEDRKDVDNE